MKHFISLFLSLAIGVQPVLAQSLQRVVSADVVEGVVAPLNLVRNSNFSKTSKDWSAYSGSGAQPTGTSGSVLGGDPILVKVSDTSFSPTGFSGSINKTANNTQGSGVLVGLNFLSKYQGKVLTISFDYKLASGTFVNGTPSDLTPAGDSSLTVWVRDVTNSAIIQPSVHRLFDVNTSLAGKFTATFQAPSNSTELQLLFHQARTETSAYNLRIANVVVAEVNEPSGSIVTDWQSYTPTFNGSPTTANVNFKYRREGDSLRVKGNFQISTVNTNDAAITLPSGLAIDTTKVGSTRKHTFGEVTKIINAANSALTKIVVGYNTTYVNQMVLSAVSGAQVLGQAGWDSIFANTDWASIDALIPIQGWSSGVNFYSSQSGNLSVARVTGSLGSGTGDRQLTLTAVYDPSSGLSGNTWVVKDPGVYLINSSNQFSTGSATNADRTAYIQIDGSTMTSSVEYGNWVLNVTNSYIGFLRAGQVLTFRADTAAVAASVSTSISIAKINSGQPIANVDTISASYWLSATATPGATTPFNFDSKEWDSHSAVTTGAGVWKFTASEPGEYEVSVYLETTNATVSSIDIYKNAAKYKTIGLASSNRATMTGSVKLLSGQFIDIRPSAATSFFGAALNAGASHISIKRTGNY